MQKNAVTENDIMGRIYRESDLLMIILLCSMGFLEVIMLVFSIVKAEFYSEYLWRYRSFYIMMLAMVVIYLGILSYVRKDIDNRFIILNAVNPIFAVFVYAWAVEISNSDRMINGAMDPTLFMTFSLTIPACVYLPVPIYLVIAVTSDIIMAYLASLSPGTAATLPNLIIFFVFQVVTGSSLLIFRRKLSERMLHIESQKEEIESLSSAQSNFFSSMSHELRTPINTIIRLDEMILAGDVSGEVKENALHIRSAGKMLLSLINDILDISRVKSGMMEFTEKPYMVRDMFSEIYGMMKPRADKQGLEFTVDLDPDLPSSLIGDEVRIKQIVMNLVNNSIKYTKVGFVEIRVSGEKKEKDSIILSIDVEDSGIGIKEEWIEDIFTAYQRLDESQTRYVEGSGLGLYIVKQLSQLMNGDVTVSSVYGEGTTFTVKLLQGIEAKDPIGMVDVGSGNNEKEE